MDFTRIHSEDDKDESSEREGRYDADMHDSHGVTFETVGHSVWTVRNGPTKLLDAYISRSTNILYTIGENAYVARQ